MNREEFISYLKSPASLDKKSLPEINELLEEFPFFQSGHLLFLKNLHNLDHIRFGSQLKKSSSIVSDRERLYDLLFPATEMGIELPVESKKEVEVPEVVPAETLNRPVVEEADEDSLPEESKKSDPPGNLQEVASEISQIKKTEPADDLREQVERRLAEIRGENIPELKAEKAEGNDIEQKEFQDSTAIVPGEESRDIEIMTEPELEGKFSEAGELLLLGDEKEVDDIYANPEYQPDEEPEGDIYKEESLLDLDYPMDNEEIKKKPDLKGEIHSFESWLNLLRTMPSEGGNENTSHGVKKAASSQREIIDKFIKENPRIQPNHDDKDEKEDMSAESIADKDGLFTETLANIYIKQGYYSKAIFFYQELSLKFPEKSIYFAGRITEIEKRINKL